MSRFAFRSRGPSTNEVFEIVRTGYSRDKRIARGPCASGLLTSTFHGRFPRIRRTACLKGISVASLESNSGFLSLG